MHKIILNQSPSIKLLILFGSITISLLILPRAIQATVDNTFDVKIGPNAGSGEDLGVSVATGDLNADGYDDIIAGADLYNSSTGQVYIHLGSASGPSSNPDITLTGEATNIKFGATVSASDVNNDSYDDVIVGAWNYSSGTGRAYIFFGGASGPATSPDITLTGANAGDQFGFSVSSAGDVNNDGFDDVIVGARSYSSNTGRAYIFFGGASGPATSPDITLTGEGSGYYFGISVSSAGDVNNDGFDDVIVGAHNTGNTGKAYIYFGSSSGPTTSPDITLTGGSSGNLFGWSVSSAGDLNNDGFDDVIVGAYKQSSFTGAAYLFLGGASGPATSPDVTLSGENIDDNFGYDVSSAGDVNNDGFDDVIVGAEGFNNYAGRAYIYYGGSTIDNSSDIIFNAETSESEFAGYTTPLAHGDLDNNGAQDIIIGSPGADSGNYDGAVYVFYGASVVTPAAVASNGSSQISAVNLGVHFDQGTTSTTKTNGIPIVRRTIILNQSRANTLTSTPIDIDRVQRLTLRVGGKKYILNKNLGSPYRLTLPAHSLSPGSYPYALTADYGSTTVTEHGQIIMKYTVRSLSDPLIVGINNLFLLAYERSITVPEWQYWVDRIIAGDKQTLPTLYGAMQWQHLYSK